MYIDSWITLLFTWTIVSQLYFNIYMCVYVCTRIFKRCRKMNIICLFRGPIIINSSIQVTWNTHANIFTSNCFMWFINYIIWQPSKWGLPWWLSDKDSACQGKTCQTQKCRFDPWFGKIPWRRKWQSTSVFLPGKSYGQRGLEGCSQWGCKEPPPPKKKQQLSIN